MVLSKNVKEVQNLNGRVVTLNKFISSGPTTTRGNLKN